MKTVICLLAALVCSVVCDNLIADQAKTKQTPRIKSKTDKPQADSLARKLAKLKADFNKARSEAIKPVIAIKDPEKRDAALKKYFEELQRISTPMAKNALKLIEKSVNDEAAAEGLTWIVSIAQGSDEANRAVALLAKHHLTSDHTLTLASRFSYGPMEWTVPLMKKLLKTDLPKEKKARLLMGLGQALKSQASFPSIFKAFKADRLKQLESQFGKSYFEKMKKVDAAKLEKESLAIYRRVIKDYGDVKSFRGKTLADDAKRAIFEIEHLSIGKVAPDIVGEDIDGVKFKLSDYRGKVVLLDFWGDW